MKRKWLVVGIILLFVGIAYAPAVAQNIEKQTVSRGTWLYVGGSGPGNYTRIQDAIDNASDGDTVFVYDDSSPYFENVIINKSINFIGEEKNTTIIDGGYGNRPINVIEIKSDSVKINSFTIQNSLNGVYINGNNVIISNNNIINNNHYGIQINDSFQTVIMYNNIKDNSVGIYNDYSYFSYIDGNNFSNNGNGILLLASTNNTIINNKFISCGIRILGDEVKFWNSHIIQENYINNRSIYYYKNIYNDTIVQNDAIQVIVANCTLMRINGLNTSNVDYGIQLGLSQNCEITNNICSNNRYSGIFLYMSSEIIVDNNYIYNNNIGIVVAHYSSNVILSNNTITASRENSIEVSISSNVTILTNNIITNKNGIYLLYISNINISNNYFNNNKGTVIYSLTNLDNSTIDNNKIIGNKGSVINIKLGNNNNITRNIIQDNIGVGIYLQRSEFNNVIAYNQIEKNDQGIVLVYCNNVNITMNRIVNNNQGIVLSYCNNIMVSFNQVENNLEKGISVCHTLDTQVRYNNINKNNPNAYFESSGTHSFTGGIISGFIRGLKELFTISFDGNYWGRERIFPVIINGKIILFGEPSWVADIEYKWWKFAWHPAQKPYDIPGVI